MKLGPVTKLDKRNTATSNKFDDSALSPNFDVTVIFSSHGQFGAIWNPYSGQMVCKKVKIELKNL